MGVGGAGWWTAGRARAGAAAFALAMPAAHALVVPSLVVVAAASWLISWHALASTGTGSFGIALASFGATSLVVGAASLGPGLAPFALLLGAANGAYAFASSSGSRTA